MPNDNSVTVSVSITKKVDDDYYKFSSDCTINPEADVDKQLKKSKRAIQKSFRVIYDEIEKQFKKELS